MLKQMDYIAYFSPRKKILILAGYAPSILNFRKELIIEMIKTCDVYVCAPSLDAELRKNLEALGVISCFDCSLNTGGMNPLKDIKYLQLVFKQVKKIQPDVVLNYTIKPVIWGSLAARLAGVKYVASMITGLGYAFTELDSVKRKVIHRLVCFLYKNALRTNQVVLFQNHDDRALFKQKRILKNTPSTIINGSGVNLEHYYYSNQFPKKITFLMVGRLLKDKGIYEYIAAARQIKTEYKEVDFHLLGWRDSNPSSVTESELKGWCDEGVIQFLGRKDDVRANIEGASVFVLPSYREGTPRSVLEAMSMGRPIITTDAPGCRETLKDGINGYLVPVKNVGALVDRMKFFLDNSALIPTYGQKSREIVVDKYDVYKVNHVIMTALKLV